MKQIVNYINGKWVNPVENNFGDVHNPSTDKVIARVGLSSAADVDLAVAAAKKAFESWRRVSPGKRSKPMFKLAGLLRDKMDELAYLIALEGGKNLADASAEMKRVLENVEVACGAPSLLHGDMFEDLSENIEGYTLKQPIGVFGIICPFNFPAMIPFWFFPYAVASGNCVIIKTSVQVPMTMARIMELIEEAGFPSGVVNILSGNRAVSDAMLSHPDIAGISFVGSTPVAKIIAQRCAQTGKRYQALGGAKNFLIVMPDAKLDRVISSLNTSCFGCAGQRCMAASVIIGVGSVYDKLRDAFVESAKTLVTGDAVDPAVDLGPVISMKAKQRIEACIQDAVNQGATLALDGRNPGVKGDPNGYFIGPTIIENVTPQMDAWHEEIFGPVASMMRIDTFEEAIEMMNRHNFGNGGSIFTQNGYYARQFQYLAQVGMVGINIGVPAPMAYLPFGGMKDSCFADIKAQGKGVFDFFTENKVITARFYPED